MRRRWSATPAGRGRRDAALRRSDELKTALLQTVSHDLRTPLTAIITAAARWLDDTSRRAERAELGSVIVEEAQRLTRLVEKLLDLSRLQAGAAEPRRDWCSLEEMRRGRASTRVARPPRRLRRRSSTPTSRSSAPTAPSSSARSRTCSRTPRRYSRRPAGLVRARVVGEPADRSAIVDRGPGIPRERARRVFEPFYRGRQGDGHGGSGLGLAIARGFVEANGGRVWAESLPGQGTSFVIELPSSRAAAGGRDRGATP